MRRIFDGLDWIRTSTGFNSHQALNLARLPISPRAPRVCLPNVETSGIVEKGGYGLQTPGLFIE